MEKKTIDYLCCNEVATDGMGHFAEKRRDPYTGHSYYIRVRKEDVDMDPIHVKDFDERMA